MAVELAALIAVQAPGVRRAIARPPNHGICNHALRRQDMRHRGVRVASSRKFSMPSTAYGHDRETANIGTWKTTPRTSTSHWARVATSREGATACLTFTGGDEAQLDDPDERWPPRSAGHGGPLLRIQT
eukprot:4524383-Pyramimonas_sp.AAC.2